MQKSSEKSCRKRAQVGRAVDEWHITRAPLHTKSSGVRIHDIQLLVGRDTEKCIAHVLLTKTLIAQVWQGMGGKDPGDPHKT